MSQVLQDPVKAGREAFERRAWQEAYALLSEADAEGGLAPEDLEVLAEAGIWSGHLEAYVRSWERAYAAYLEQGNRLRAGFVAVILAHEYENRLQAAIAAGWLSRAVRLLDEEPEAAEHGYLELQRSLMAWKKQDFDAALEHAERAEEIGRKHGSRALEVRALQRRGIALVEMGRLDEGRALLDEASAAAIGGELDAYTTVTVYCNTIGTCRDLADYGRAGEWTDTAIAWCDENAASAFPGMCRVNRAEVMRVRGEWDAAEQHATLASEELRSWNPRVAGAAFYELGELRLRKGDLAGAEKAFRDADDFGREPQPGLARLRLAEGRTDAAAASIRRALSEAKSQLARSRLLPAQVEIAIETNDLERAAEATLELGEIAATYGTSALEAAAVYARGHLQLAQGSDEAMTTLRRALKLWQEVGAPYDAARTRVLLAEAYRAAGDEDSAQDELDAAVRAFERLGAARDGRKAEELRTGRPRRTFMFTDIVDSTKLTAALGEEKWLRVLERHDETLRAAFAKNSGSVVKHTGDGFFVAFEDAAAAVAAAIEIQRALQEQGIAPDVRIGLHTGEATSAGNGDFSGGQVNEAARIAALGGAGEIVASRESIDGVAARVSEPREVDLRGFEGKPVEVVSIDWR